MYNAFGITLQQVNLHSAFTGWAAVQQPEKPAAEKHYPLTGWVSVPDVVKCLIESVWRTGKLADNRDTVNFYIKILPG